MNEKQQSTPTDTPFYITGTDQPKAHTHTHTPTHTNNTHQFITFTPFYIIGTHQSTADTLSDRITHSRLQQTYHPTPITHTSL